MNDATLNYVRQHADDDVRLLALRGSKDPEVDMTMALQQIQGLQTARRKLPAWATLDDIVYPPHLNMEQCSSEQTAHYKATICRRLIAQMSKQSSYPRTSLPTYPPSTLLDLTGGFGVDFSFMSDCFDEATYVERDTQLFAIASHNLNVLGKRVKTINADGIEVLRQTEHATVIFLDPARRDDHGGRTYGIADCTPNVLTIKDELLQKAGLVILKLSPMLDWHKAVQDLGEAFVREVHIVSVDNECKELLVVLSNKGCGFSLFCVNDEQVFEVTEDTMSSRGSRGSKGSMSSRGSKGSMSSRGSMMFLYEPNASIMKAGCFTEVAGAFQVMQLAQNSHLFISETFRDDFPGRKFKIIAVSSMKKHELKEKLANIHQANITVRNFPLSVADLRKRLRLSEGGSMYIFATTLANGDRVLILCQRL